MLYIKPLDRENESSPALFLLLKATLSLCFLTLTVDQFKGKISTILSMLDDVYKGAITIRSGLCSLLLCITGLIWAIISVNK